MLNKAILLASLAIAACNASLIATTQGSILKPSIAMMLSLAVAYYNFAKTDWYLH